MFCLFFGCCAKTISTTNVPFGGAVRTKFTQKQMRLFSLLSFITFFCQINFIDIDIFYIAIVFTPNILFSINKFHPIFFPLDFCKKKWRVTHNFPCIPPVLKILFKVFFLQKEDNSKGKHTIIYLNKNDKTKKIIQLLLSIICLKMCIL